MPELNPYESPQLPSNESIDSSHEQARQWNQFYIGVKLCGSAVKCLGLGAGLAMLLLVMTAGFGAGEEVARFIAFPLISIASILFVLLHSSGTMRMPGIPSVTRARALFRFATGALILGLIVLPILPFWIGLRQAQSSELETFVVIFGYSAMLTFLFVVHCAALFMGMVQVGRYLKNSVVVKFAIFALVVLIITFHLDIFFVRSIFKAGVGNAEEETVAAIIIAMVGALLFWGFFTKILMELLAHREKKTLEKS